MLYRLRFRTTPYSAPLYTKPGADILGVLEKKWFEDRLPYFLESVVEAKTDEQAEFAPVTILTEMPIKMPRVVIDID